MAHSIAPAVRVHVRREGFTVFERVIRVARRSPARAGLVATIVAASALGLFGTLVVVPPLREATRIFEEGIFVHDARAPAACTFCELPVRGAALMSWEVPSAYARAVVLSRGLFAVGAAALLALLVEVLHARRPRRLSAGSTAHDEIASEVLSSTDLVSAERGAIHLVRPDRLSGTLERGDLSTPYRSSATSLLAATEMTPRGPVIRLRAGDRVKARIADLTLDVEGLDRG